MCFKLTGGGWEPDRADQHLWVWSALTLRLRCLSPPPHHADCAQVQGPELKPGLNLPYLGVTHWHSPSECVFLSSLRLTHTLPSNHKLLTSLRLHPPPTISPTGSFRKHSPSPAIPVFPLCVSHFPPHTRTFTGSERLVQACVRGILDVTEVRQWKAIHHLSPSPPMIIQTHTAFDKTCCRMSQTHFITLDSCWGFNTGVSWRYWCDFVLLLFRWPPGKSSSAPSVLPLMDCPWIRHTWWRGMTLVLEV